MTGTSSFSPAFSAISYDSAASIAPSYAATAPLARVMFGFRSTFLSAPLHMRANRAGPSPSDLSRTSTYRAFLLAASNAAAVLWLELLPLPYASVLCSERSVALTVVPSMESVSTSYFASPPSNHARPSTSSSLMSIALILLWNVENDGVSKRPPASSLAFPSSCLYLAPVSFRNTPMCRKYESSYLYGRPLLPLLGPSALSIMIDSFALHA